MEKTTSKKRHRNPLLSEQKAEEIILVVLAWLRKEYGLKCTPNVHKIILSRYAYVEIKCEIPAPAYLIFRDIELSFHIRQSEYCNKSGKVYRVDNLSVRFSPLKTETETGWYDFDIPLLVEYQRPGRIKLHTIERQYFR